MNINNINTNKVTVKTSNISKIKIPMIQRDYVQGLKNEKLEPFLNTLINALLNGQKLSLDFIYGNINEDGVFEPIDGQQRLTTLALLTFYLYYRQKGSDNNKTLNNPFKLITYATRQSAKKFCELLSKNEFKDKFENNPPSNVIKENSKYFREYDEDTTISAMLKTLDKIHEIINEKKPNINSDAGQDDIQSFINTLARNIDKINFHIFPMESFNLSDDLYIKMNGRGKQLSSFDNFKAEYFKWLEDASDDNIDKLIPNCILQKNTQNKLETLKRKFDTEYLDIFWDYALENSKGTSEAPEPEKLFFRFINRFVVGKYLLLSDKQKNDFEETFIDDGIKSEKDAVVFNNIELYTTLLNENDDYKNYTYNYKIINILENLSNLQKCCSNNFKNILNFIFNPLWEDEELDIFPKKDWLTYKQVLIFNAITSFLEQDNIIDNYKCDKCNKLKERVIDNKTFLMNEECNMYNILMTLKRISRIVWNITEQYNLLNTISKDNYKTVISRLDFSKLAKVENIYNKFQNICGDVDDYKKIKKHNVNNDEDDIDIIIKDEVRKCQYLYNDNKIDTSLEQQFIKLEKLPYLKGTIGFLINKESLPINDNLIKICSRIFSNKASHNPFIRALLSKLDKIDIIKSNIYKSDSVVKQLINEPIHKDYAKEILISIKDENAIQNILIQFTKSHSPVHICNINNYIDFTALTTHESLYREEDNIDYYKIHFTDNSYWLMKHKYKSASTLEMRSYCPVRFKLIGGLRMLNNESLDNNKYTVRNVHISMGNSKIMFEHNSIFIDNYNNKFSLHTFSDLNRSDINEHVLDLYEKIIDKSENYENLYSFLTNNRDYFKDIISSLDSYINPFEYNKN